MEFSVSCGVDVSPVWDVTLCDDTSARTITAISSIMRFTIVNSSMIVLVNIIIISVIKDIALIVTRKMQLLVLSL